MKTIIRATVATATRDTRILLTSASILHQTAEVELPADKALVFNATAKVVLAFAKTMDLHLDRVCIQYTRKLLVKLITAGGNIGLDILDLDLHLLHALPELVLVATIVLLVKAGRGCD
jgi:hypothetical protein